MQALGEVFLNLYQRSLDRTLKAQDPGRTVTLDHNPLQAQKTCAVMSRRRQVRLQATHQRQGQGSRD